MLAFLEALASRTFPLDFPGQFINNSFENGPADYVSKEVFNPSSAELLMSYNFSRQHIEAVLDASFNARKSLLSIPIDQRLTYVATFHKILADYSSSIKSALQIEAGKPMWEAELEFDNAMNMLEWYTSNPHDNRLTMTTHPLVSDGLFGRRPVGTALAQVPFSTPFLSLCRFIAAAISAGCPLITMGSTNSSIISCVTAQIIQQLPLPSGSINILCGNFEAFRQMGLDNRVAFIAYRGSGEHCATLRKDSAIRANRRIVVHSGGKNAVFFHPSGDINSAVNSTLIGSLKSAGQLCASTSRVFVPAEKFGDFVDHLVQALNSIKIGPTDTEDPSVVMGPLYSQKSVDKFLRFQTMAKRESKKTLMWGKALSNQSGFFVSPGVHVMEKFDASSAYQSNVLLFPDIAIYEYDNVDEAVEWCNATKAPLVTSVISRDKDFYDRSPFSTPNVKWNLPTVELEHPLSVTGLGPCKGESYHILGLIKAMTYATCHLKSDASLDRHSYWPENS